MSVVRSLRYLRVCGKSPNRLKDIPQGLKPALILKHLRHD